MGVHITGLRLGKVSVKYWQKLCSILKKHDISLIQGFFHFFPLGWPKPRLNGGPWANSKHLLYCVVYIYLSCYRHTLRSPVQIWPSVITWPKFHTLQGDSLYLPVSVQRGRSTEDIRCDSRVSVWLTPLYCQCWDEVTFNMHALMLAQ